MQHSQRLDQKLYTLREEVRTMSREKELVERVWRERLQRCQRQLQAKEDELIRQSQYFESFKSQLQNKLKQSRDTEEALQNRIYTLEKQLLEMTVTAATGIATMGPVRITAGSVTHWEEQDRLPSLRGEGEGEEAKKEELKKQWPKSDKSKNSDQTRLQGFILSLQEDLRVLLEREEKAMTEHRALMDQLHEAQESSHFLGCKVEEMKSEIHHLNLSKLSLEAELEELREENQRLQHCLRDAADHLPNTTDVCIQKADISDEEKPSLPAVLPVHHQATAESSQNSPVDPSSAAKSETSCLATNGPQTLFGNFGSTANPSFQSLSLTTETIDELRMGTWCYNGILNLEESPGEDSDALREAYRSLGLGGDLDFIKEQRDRFEEALQLAHEQLKMATQENARLKSKIKQQQGEAGLEEEDSSKDVLSDITNLEDSARFSVGSEDLVQALNEENRALAERIQELRDHIEITEEEIMNERRDVKEQICRLEIDGARQQQEINEQAALVTELTRKTEDDLNIIMELQQKLVEYEELKEEIRRKKLFGFQCKHTQTVFRKDNIDECVDIVVNCVIESDKEPQYMSNKQQASQVTDKSSDNLDLMNEEVDQLTKVVQSLKSEQEDLMGRIKSQRLQQKEVAQSIRAQTEEKQRLTREVWALKEEKDNISKSLSGLKQEREALTRSVCGFKDEREQFYRFMARLREEKDQLSEDLPKLKKEKEAMLEAISSGVWERDQITKSIQNLQNESLQLNQAVSNLKLEKDELTNHLKSLEEQRDKEHLCSNLQEEYAKLQKSVSSLKEEERRMTFSVSRLKQEEKQMTVLIQGLQEEHSRLQAMSPNNRQTSEVDPSYPGNANAWGAKYENQYQNNLEDQNDFTMQIDTLSAELQKSQDEVQQIKAERQRLQSDLFQSEVKREEAERRASQLAESLFKVTDESNQLQEAQKECESLKAQVKDLQDKVIGLTREKNEAQTLKARTDEQYNMLAAQLKAKTVALEELNSEYIRLKQNQGTKEDLGTALVSMQSRYSDIRAKYDALLHRKSQADMDIAPLKAKLSCLVVKCQERNNVLVQMTKIMQKNGCIDYILKQQVEQLLTDPALQSYASTFTTGLGPGYPPEIMITFEDTKRFCQNQPSSSSPSKQPHIREITPLSKVYGDDRSTPLSLSPSKFSYESIQTLKALSPKSVSPIHDHREVLEFASPSVSYKDTNTTQLLLSPKDHKRNIVRTSPTLDKKIISPNSASPISMQKEILGSTSPSVPVNDTTLSTQNQLSARGSVLKPSGFQQLQAKAKSTPDLTWFTESSGLSSGPGSSSSLTGFGSSRRLSSPEKIISLQEQLQKTLLSSFQAPVGRGRGRGQQPRKCLSFSAQSLAFTTTSQIQTPNLSVCNSTASRYQVTTSASQPTSGGSTKPATSNKLFNAVVSRSTAVTFSPVAQTFAHKHFKSNVSRASSNVSSLSTSSAAQNKAKLTSTPGATSPKLPYKLTTDLSADVQRSSSMQNKSNFLGVSPATTDCNVSKSSDTPESNATDAPGPSRSCSFNISSRMGGGASLASPQLTSAYAKKSPSSTEKARTPTRIKEETPAEVRSVEVIKAVGVTGLMVGWERPPLDELGCSNGTFVYGYRVFVDGVFHKSVMSSACTKCILENVNLSVPIKISVQTLGSNGLSSNCVHTMYSQKT